MERNGGDLLRLTTILDKPVACLVMLRKILTSLTSKFLLSTGLCLFAGDAKAQVGFDEWTADAGLPQNSVYAIVQTRDSYIWLATLDGLVRFDGVRFTVFNKSNSPGISNNRFVYLYEDAQGDLWAGTEQSGVVRLHQGRFTSYGLEQGLSSLRVVWLTGDANENVLVYFPGMLGTVRWSGEKFEAFDDPSAYSPIASSPPRENQTVFCQRDSTHIGCFVNGRYEKFLYSTGFPNSQLIFFYDSAQDTAGAL